MQAWISSYSRKLEIYKFTTPERMHPRLLKELLNIIMRQPSPILQRQVQLQKGPDDWGKANAISIFKTGKKKIWRNYRLPSVFGKITEQTHLKAILRHIKNRKVTGNTGMYLQRANCVWPTKLFCVMRWLMHWLRAEQWISFTFTLARLLIWSSVANRNLVKYNTGKWKILHLLQNKLFSVQSGD